MERKLSTCSQTPSSRNRFREFSMMARYLRFRRSPYSLFQWRLRRRRIPCRQTRFFGSIFCVFFSVVLGFSGSDRGYPILVGPLMGPSLASAQFGAQSFGSHFTGQAANQVQNGSVFRETPQQTETRYQQDQLFQRQTMARQQAESRQNTQAWQHAEARTRQSQLDANAALQSRESARSQHMSDVQQLQAIEQQQFHRTTDENDFFHAPYPLPDSLREYRDTEYQPVPHTWLTPDADPTRSGPRFTLPNQAFSEKFKRPSWAEPQYRDAYLALQTRIQWAETRTDPARFRWIATPNLTRSSNQSEFLDIHTPPDMPSSPQWSSDADGEDDISSEDSANVSPASLVPQWQLSVERIRQSEHWRRQFTAGLQKYTPHWYHPAWWATHQPVVTPWWHFKHSYLHYPPEYWWKTPTWQTLTIWLAPWNWYEPYIYEYGVGGNAFYDASSLWMNGVQISSIAHFRDSAAVLAIPEVVLTPSVTPTAPRSLASSPTDASTSPPITTTSPVPQSEVPLDATLSTASRMEWLGLGTFALVTESAAATETLSPPFVLQLSVSRDGLLSGMFYDPSAPDATFAVVGRIDTATQRAAFTVACFDDLVFETGAYHLTQTEATLLVHDGTPTLRTYLLIRLEPPKQ